MSATIHKFSLAESQDFKDSTDIRGTVWNDASRLAKPIFTSSSSQPASSVQYSVPKFCMLTAWDPSKPSQSSQHAENSAGQPSNYRFSFFSFAESSRSC